MPFKFMEFHESTMEALKYSIDEIEKENLILKERVKELENDVLPRLLFDNPIVIIRPLRNIEDI